MEKIIMTEKQEYEKELIYHLRSQTGKDNSDARYLRHLLDNFSLYAPLSDKTIQMAKKIVKENKALLERLNPEDVKWRAKDLREDIRDHLEGFENMSAKRYKEESVSLAKNKIDPYMQLHRGKKQFVFWGDNGQVVCDLDGTIRGYYPSSDIKKTKNAYKEKKQCKKIL